MSKDHLGCDDVIHLLLFFKKVLLLVLLPMLVVRVVLARVAFGDEMMVSAKFVTKFAIVSKFGHEQR